MARLCGSARYYQIPKVLLLPDYALSTDMPLQSDYLTA